MKISNLQYNSLMWFLIRGCFIGVSLNNIIYVSHQDSTLSVLLAIILGFIPLLLYFYIRNYQPTLDIFEKIKLLFGKFGNVLNVICMIFAYLFTIMILSDLTHFISSQFLYYTSSTIISITFMVLVVYALFKGIKTIAKTSLIVFFFVTIIAIFIILGLIGNINITNFEPILYNGISPIFKSTLIILVYNVMPIFFLLAIPKKNVSNDNIKVNILFYLLSMFSIFSVSFMTIAIFDVNLALLYEYPGFHLLRQVNIGEFVDRIEIFLSIEWIISMCIMLIFCLYFGNLALKRIINFSINKKWHFPLLIIEATILIVLQIFVVDNFLQSSAREHDIILYSALGIFIFLYLILSLRISFKNS